METIEIEFGKKTLFAEFEKSVNDCERGLFYEVDLGEGYFTVGQFVDKDTNQPTQPYKLGAVYHQVEGERFKLSELPGPFPEIIEEMILEDIGSPEGRSTYHAPYGSVA